MPMSTTAELVDQAVRRGGAVAAFNVVTLEHAEGIIAGAEQRSRAVILQVSENAVAYHGRDPAPLGAALHALASDARVPIALHLDHVEDESLLRQDGLRSFSSVMVDAGRLPYADNVAQTAAATQALHALGMFVEAELGYVGGKESQTTSAHVPGTRTDPDQAREFVLATQVDALAVAVGSSHAMTTQTAQLDHDLIARLAAAVPVPLVLHGSSGVPTVELRRAVGAGIVKINIGTALNVAFSSAVRRVLSDERIVDPRIYLAEARSAVALTVANLLGVLSD
ncbi:MAG: class II fructose-bisphosphate aldolase [Actinomycetota bacterium]|nr:class II fructose-bisphosphate aldolase [Actinomycetota bacterium]